MNANIITDEYVFFYGGIYSQWYACSFNIFNLHYNCAEQFMMAQKAIMFKDIETFSKIMATSNPAEQKALGRTVKNFDKDQWESRCKDIVIAGNLGKFGQNKDLLNQMIETGDRKFVEGSPVDKVWGIGLGLNNPLIFDKKNWQGTNWLGECLDYVKMTLKTAVE